MRIRSSTLHGHELRTGGYLSRTELFGDLNTGLNVEHINELHTRLVMDYLNQFWKVQWLGIGADYARERLQGRSWRS